LPTTFGTRHRVRWPGLPTTTTKEPFIVVECTSHLNVYRPARKVSVQRGWTISPTGVLELTPGPVRWKLCAFERSCTCIV